MLSEKCQPQKATCCYDSISVTFQKGQNYRDREQITGCQGLVGGKGMYVTINVQLQLLIQLSNHYGELRKVNCL